MARNGVRSFDFRTTDDAIEVDIVAALAFGFADSAAEGDRTLAGVQLTAENNILAEVRQVIAMSRVVGLPIRLNCREPDRKIRTEKILSLLHN